MSSPSTIITVPDLLIVTLLQITRLEFGLNSTVPVLTSFASVPGELIIVRLRQPSYLHPALSSTVILLQFLISANPAPINVHFVLLVTFEPSLLAI